MKVYEKRANVDVIQVSASCHIKGCDGRLVSTGNEIEDGERSGWIHACDVCDQTNSLPQEYPRMEFKPGEDTVIMRAALIFLFGIVAGFVILVPLIHQLFL